MHRLQPLKTRGHHLLDVRVDQDDRHADLLQRRGQLARPRMRADDEQPLRLRLGGSWGSYYDGRRLSGDVNLTWQPSPHFGTNLGLNRNVLTSMGPEAEDFTTNVVNLRAAYSFSPQLRAKAYVQYNDATRAILSNYLLHWIIRDGTEVYLVYNDVFDSGPDFNPVSTGRTIMVKATYLFLF